MILLTFLVSSLNVVFVDKSDSVPIVNIQEIEISSYKVDNKFNSDVSASYFDSQAIQRGGVESIKDFSALSPNFYQPDYGSRITSSIYVRGFGSRMDNPVVGLIIDGIPILNKNNYDFRFLDIQSVSLLRGPQGTLFGRNTIGGVIDITTTGIDLPEKISLTAQMATANTANVKITVRKRVSERFGFSVVGSYEHTDGYFTNRFDNSMCEVSDDASVGARIFWSDRKGWQYKYSLSLGLLNQGGYAYRYLDSINNRLDEVNYNDPSGYSRKNMINGFVAEKTSGKVNITNVISYQYLDDKMTLDNDFLPKSYFTMSQSQKERGVTEELILKSVDKYSGLEWITGAYVFAKWLNMEAPVTFKQDGIDELILANANKGIHTAFPGHDILIEESFFPISSSFIIPAYGVAIYNQTSYQWKKWRITGGLRGDFEYTSMKYDSRALIHYRFTMTMPHFKLLETRYNGQEQISFAQILPKVSVSHELPFGNLYFSVAKGYKTGGFNTQIFSDILREVIMRNMMADLRISMDNSNATVYNYANASEYRPEVSWNYEFGIKAALFDNMLNVSTTLFWIDCRNQQITVFPPGKNTGRQMSNAGSSRSRGVEASASFYYGSFRLGTDFGYTDAFFTDYYNGAEDYSGNRLPYAPRTTLSADASYRINVNSDFFDYAHINIGTQGVGDIVWNESNSLSQPYYHLFSAGVKFTNRKGYILFWGKNLFNAEYSTFYFKSMDNSFFSSGKPFRFGILINIKL